MGWANGSALMSELITSLKKHVKSKETREKIYTDMIAEFESFDCDTLHECADNKEDTAFTKAWKAYLKKYNAE